MISATLQAWEEQGVDVMHNFYKKLFFIGKDLRPMVNLPALAQYFTYPMTTRASGKGKAVALSNIKEKKVRKSRVEDLNDIDEDELASSLEEADHKKARITHCQWAAKQCPYKVIALEKIIKSATKGNDPLPTACCLLILGVNGVQCAS